MAKMLVFICLTCGFSEATKHSTWPFYSNSNIWIGGRCCWPQMLWCIIHAWQCSFLLLNVGPNWLKPLMVELKLDRDWEEWVGGRWAFSCANLWCWINGALMYFLSDDGQLLLSFVAGVYSMLGSISYLLCHLLPLNTIDCSFWEINPSN